MMSFDQIESPSIVTKQRESAEIAAQTERFLAAGGRIQTLAGFCDKQLTIEEQVVHLSRTTSLSRQMIGKRVGLTAVKVRMILLERGVNRISVR